jgi:murein tripeptide amidase MpaA
LFSLTLAAAQSSVKTPEAFLSYRPGEQFTPHHRLVAYFEHLADNSKTTMRLEHYGATNEKRPLLMAFFSSPENMNRLEQIRLNNLRIAGVAEGQPDLSNPVAIVWLSMSVHGNEPTGSESSMELAFRLATQTDPKIKEWLKNTVVIIDPALNPDGYDRYTHWNIGASNFMKNYNPDSREHREPWPGGRVNHYYYDLNRDWAWGTQVETQQRVGQYHRWLPHIHADLHEQYMDNPYYFAPAAEPMHDYITPWQREFQIRIGENHARYFDNNGWLYFTKEVFDLFYPSYGDTYPMFNGAIGMTYEQGGGPGGGRAVVISNGDTLTLYDRIKHHLTTSLSTIEMGSRNAATVVEHFHQFYKEAVTQPQGHYKAFVIPVASNDPNKINALCKLLDRNQIRYGKVDAGLSGVAAFDYTSGQETSVSIQPNDLVISAYQPKSTMLEVLFEPDAHLSDSLTYDITAWSVPYAYGIEAYALKNRLEPKKPFPAWKATPVALAASPVAWCIHRHSLAEAQFMAALLQKNIRPRYATKPFAAADQQFDAGTIVITRADNRPLSADLDSLVKAAAAQYNVALHPIFTGYASAGKDFGSESFVLIKHPEVALVYGDDIDENSFGHTWFFFEHELNYPISPIPLDKLQKVKLGNFTTLIFPNGNYNLTDSQIKLIQEWVRAGGRLIGFEGGAKAFAEKDGFSLKAKEAAKKDPAAALKPYASRERESVSDQLPGAIVKGKTDNSHPIAYGLGPYYFSLKTIPDAFEMPEKGSTAIYLEEDYQSYGFIGSRVKPRLKKTPLATMQKMGEGEAVFLIDNPLFRSFWQQGKVLFSNALFF